MANEDDDMDSEEVIPEEVLNTFTLPGFPLCNLKLKFGTPVILLRNLDLKNGLSNGTRPILTTKLSYYPPESSTANNTANPLALVNSTPSRSAFHYLDRRLLPTSSSNSSTLVLSLSPRLTPSYKFSTITHTLKKDWLPRLQDCWKTHEPLFYLIQLGYSYYYPRL
ncbi:hypothetical protein PGTUg99_012199, partial [Puccinia graminis f. sp. tritici]